MLHVINVAQRDFPLQAGDLLVEAPSATERFTHHETSILQELIFMLTGCVLFLATGALTVEQYQNHTAGAHKDTGLAYGSLAIINGILCFVDCALLGKQIKNRGK